jgi:hypothetical protein
MTLKTKEMKREIKFRGKRIDTKEWIIGNLHIPNKLFKDTLICPDTIYGDIAPGFEDGDDFDLVKSYGCAIGCYHRVISETIGQFTGLKDRKGIEIFEGDIVDISKFEGSALYRMVINDIMQLPNELFGSNVDWYEVIGDIYDNLSLLNYDTKAIAG